MRLDWGDLTFEILMQPDLSFIIPSSREGKKSRTQRLAAKKQATIHTETRQQRRAAERAARKGRTA